MMRRFLLLTLNIARSILAKAPRVSDCGSASLWDAAGILNVPVESFSITFSSVQAARSGFSVGKSNNAVLLIGSNRKGVRSLL